MRLTLLLGIFVGVLLIAFPQLTTVAEAHHIAEPAQLAIFAIGLIALGVARNQQSND